jgi:O-antigen/teichoic acid export membrane protein
MSNLKKLIINNGIVGIMSKMLTLLVNIYSIRILINTVPDENFVVIAAAQSFVSWLTLFGGGFYSFITNEVARDKSIKKFIIAFNKIILLLLIFSMVLLVFLSFVSQKTSFLLILIVVIGMISFSLSGVFDATLNGYMKNEINYYINIVICIGQFTLLYFLEYLNNATVLYIFSVIYFPVCVKTLLSFTYLNKLNEVKEKLCLESINFLSNMKVLSVISFTGAIAALNSIGLVWVSSLTGNLVLVEQLTVLVRMNQILGGLITLITIPVMPHIAKYGFTKSHIFSIPIIIFYVISVVVFLNYFGLDFIEIWLGSSSIFSISIMMCYSIYFFGSVIIHLVQIYSLALNKFNLLIKIAICEICVFVFGAAPLLFNDKLNLMLLLIGISQILIFTYMVIYEKKTNFNNASLQRW